jgi:hypothetical protein
MKWSSQEVESVLELRPADFYKMMATRAPGL